VRAEIAAIAPPEQRFADRRARCACWWWAAARARALNTGVPQAIAALGAGVPVQVRHQSGEKMHAEAVEVCRPACREITPFIADMAEAFAWADLVVCRAGASTLAELCAVGVGSVLVPFPAAVDDHQTRNAEYLVERGAAVC
jgi:UDP-N-acetylglucosamine--N-acetylmuramyl-(pentapeptide) pyrophosphoryl-undecaprenol N-acetylglucosamine transferase